ncbi:uncharacterized mitochondrial protein AtMg01250-like [Rutidosis leptorrhynchoides]|uniref:uncharacterized mitochondrial protein AtMg01250-like n=1 Tax=Rutidosis leptorrhynchoides TaxID=125765 RepID=UPI003A993F40
MGFGLRWRQWIFACLSSTSISILVKGSPTKEFALQKGVRQGDPLSPYLFMMVAEVLNHLTKSAVLHNRFSGIPIGRGDLHVTHLQYVDDTLFFGEWNRRNAQNLTKILKCFESTSGLKINFHKSCVYGLGVSKVETKNMAAWLGCVAGTLPITYLGLPLGSSMKLSKS